MTRRCYPKRRVNCCGDIGVAQNLITPAQLPDKIPLCRSPLIFCQAD